MAGLGQGIKIDLTGQQFGCLLVIKRDTPKKIDSGKVFEVWECLCKCGKTAHITGKQLRRGQNSCGCRNLDGRFRREKTGEDINITKILASYKGHAVDRGYCYCLSFEEAKKLLLSDCHYCGAVPSREFRVYPDIEITLVNGIDRVDSSKGYTTDNVVPCCKLCNRAKMNMPVSGFLVWLEQIAKFRS